jgi:hypothetical protein
LFPTPSTFTSNCIDLLQCGCAFVTVSDHRYPSQWACRPGKLPRASLCARFGAQPIRKVVWTCGEVYFRARFCFWWSVV